MTGAGFGMMRGNAAVSGGGAGAGAGAGACVVVVGCVAVAMVSTTAVVVVTGGVTGAGVTTGPRAGRRITTSVGGSCCFCQYTKPAYPAPARMKIASNATIKPYRRPLFAGALGFGVDVVVDARRTVSSCASSNPHCSSSASAAGGTGAGIGAGAGVRGGTS